ncbi:PA0069 family radical SAM protein [bacterium]|jgi:DNA repair photolyase|nr:PA0069 family radical SAM protein [bacterium]
MNPQKGRGAISNVSGRFNLIQYEPDMEDLLNEEDRPSLKTQFLEDSSKTVVNENTSPDLPFRYSVNPYRGCEHGCAYCYARPTHEYFGFSAGLDFESRILVKRNAPELLRKRLLSPRWQPAPIFMSGVTDCYQPAERKFRLTRGCLEVLTEFYNPVTLITKNALVARDVDVLKDLAEHRCAQVYFSITTLDAEMARKLEPRTSTPQSKLIAMETLAKAGVPVGVNIAPVIPGLTDHEMPAILKAASEAGARRAGFIPVRLPYSVKDLFAEWLETNFPDRKNKVLNAIRSIRDGELNNPEFGSRMQGSGPRADQIHALFDLFTKKHGINQSEEEVLSTENFRRPGEQLGFFGRP